MSLYQAPSVLHLDKMTEEEDKDAIPSHTSRSDSTVSEWELIPDPPTPSEEHKHLIPPTPTVSQS